MKINIVKDTRKIKCLYHYTLKENVNSILTTKKIMSTDSYVFFTDSYDKSLELFEEEMMSNKQYVDLDLKIKRRNFAKKDDYRIIKIPYKNDGKFVKFKFDGNYGDNVYTKSIIHEGNLLFDKAEVLKIKEIESDNSFSNFKISNFVQYLASFIMSFIFPFSVNAESWLDEGNYNIEWLNDCDQYSCSLNDEKDLAGAVYLINKENYDFKTINGVRTIYLTGEDHDFSNYDWIKPNNNSICLCGIHRIILKPNNVFGIDACRSSNISVVYKLLVTLKQTNFGTSSIDKDTALTGEKVTITAIPNKGYYLKSILINSESMPLSSFSNEGENKYGYSVYDSNVTIQPIYEPEKFNLIYDVDEGVKINNYPLLRYGENYTIHIDVLPAYKIKSAKLNGDEIEIENGDIKIRNVQSDVTIKIETEKITPIFDSSDKIVVNLYEIEKYNIDYSDLRYYVIDYLMSNIFNHSFSSETIDFYSNNKKMFSIDNNRNIIINDLTSDDNFIVLIDDNFKDYFKEITGINLPDNYNKINFNFTKEINCFSDIKIKELKIEEVSGLTSIINTPFFNDYSINTSINFFAIDDYIKYKITIENNSKEDYVLDLSNFNSKNLDYTLEYENNEKKVLSSSNTAVYLTIKYVNEINSDLSEQKIIKLNLKDKDGNIINLTNDIENPKTGINNYKYIIIIILLLSLLFVFINNKKIKKLYLIFLFMGLSIVILDAECSQSLVLNTNINISRFNNDTIYINNKKIDIDSYLNNVCNKEKPILFDNVSISKEERTGILTISISSVDFKEGFNGVGLEVRKNSETLNYEIVDYYISNDTNVFINGKINDIDSIFEFVKNNLLKEEVLECIEDNTAIIV